jgi:tRNA1Val (adenine37-N6)-methyltransferase
MFHFKKFSLEDNKSAMKIGTDAVLLGAWTPCENETLILDIGTGSGILALMMAQRNYKTHVDAVEINTDAATLADQNAKLSPWSDQVCVFNSPIQEYASKANKKYSLIICNPPFFTDSLKAPDEARNVARHNDTLPVNELLSITSKLLAEDGKAAFIIPADVLETWTREAAKHMLFPSLITKVRSSPNHQPHRVLLLFKRKEISTLLKNEICIYSSEKSYSQEYIKLTNDFYLNF